MSFKKELFLGEEKKSVIMYNPVPPNPYDFLVWNLKRDILKNSHLYLLTCICMHLCMIDRKISLNEADSQSPAVE